MRAFQFAVSALHLLSAALAGITAGRLIWLRLQRRYRGFFVYLVIRCLRTAILLPFDRRSTTYFWIYIYTEPILWVVYVLVVLEIYWLVLESFQGIYLWARRIVLALSLSAALLSGLSLLPTWSATASRSRLVLLYSHLERGLTSSLVLFLLGLSAFLVWIPAPLRRNVVRHARLFTLYFLTLSLGWLAGHLAGQEATPLVNGLFVVANCSALVGWLIAIDNKGEELPPKLEYASDSEERALARLEALNQALLKSTHK